jgi:protein tyrosine phosphatase (PTP) superfamily phosphohydrolase (DUF442 family)
MDTSRFEEIRDYYQIGENIFTAGQPTPEQIALLGKSGMEVVINLATEKSPDALPNEMELVMDAGMAYVHIPVIWEKPELVDFEKFMAMFSRHEYHSIFVHCARNMRVSAFIYLYRVLVDQENPENCLDDLLTIWKPDEVWQPYIDQVLREVKVPPSIKERDIDWTGYTAFNREPD